MRLSATDACTGLAVILKIASSALARSGLVLLAATWSAIKNKCVGYAVNRHTEETIMRPWLRSTLIALAALLMLPGARTTGARRHRHVFVRPCGPFGVPARSAASRWSSR